MASASTAAPVQSAAAVVAVLLARYQVHAFVLLGCGDHVLGQGGEPLLAHVDRVHRPEVDGQLPEVGPGADHSQLPDPLPEGKILQIFPTGLDGLLQICRIVFFLQVGHVVDVVAASVPQVARQWADQDLLVRACLIKYWLHGGENRILELFWGEY